VLAFPCALGEKYIHQPRNLTTSRHISLTFLFRPARLDHSFNLHSHINAFQFEINYSSHIHYERTRFSVCDLRSRIKTKDSTTPQPHNQPQLNNYHTNEITSKSPLYQPILALRLLFNYKQQKWQQSPNPSATPPAAPPHPQPVKTSPTVAEALATSAAPPQTSNPQPSKRQP